MLPAVDAVVLDVGGVLLLPDPAIVRKRLSPFGACPSDEQCDHAYYAGMAAIDGLGADDFSHADRAVVRSLGIGEEDLEAAAAELAAAYAEPWVPVAGAADQLRRLRAAGVSLAIVSNATGEVEATLARHGICAVAGASPHTGVPEVAAVVDSFVVGVQKPEPAIFALALEALGSAPERCVYVGDSVHFDVNGAIAAGLWPVHLTALTGCAGEHPHYPGLSHFVDAFLGERR